MLKLVDIKSHDNKGGLTLEVSYFFLKQDYPLGDGTHISKDVLLRKLSNPDEDGLILFETVENGGKRVFWANDTQVQHIEDKVEDWGEVELSVIQKITSDNWM